MSRRKLLQYSAIMALMISPFSLYAQFAGGSGTQEDPYQIETWAHLNDIRDNHTAHFVLNNNLTSSTAGYNTYASETANDGAGWEPIGNVTCEMYMGPDDCMMYTTERFSGSLDGQGYTIRDIKINRPSGYPDSMNDTGVGLFVALEGATVKNLRIENANVAGRNQVGILVAITYPEAGMGGGAPAIVENVHVQGAVSGFDNVGGLVGFLQEAVVKRSSINGTVQADGGKGGGLAGYMILSTLENSYAIGVVLGGNVGGLVGQLNGYSQASTLRYNYSSMLVQTTASPGREGGMIGTIGTNNFPFTITANFWNSSLANQALLGVGNYSSSNTPSGIVSKQDSELRQQSTFENAGWDFSTIWKIDEGNSYPTHIQPGFTVSSFSPLQATAGDTLTILGENVSQIEQVTIGAAEAFQFTVVDETTLNVVVGWGATGALVFSGGGVTETLSGFTYLPSRVYDFNYMPTGTIEGIDGWKTIPTGNSSPSYSHRVLIPGETSAYENNVVIGHDGSRALRFPFEGGGVGARSTRVYNDQFGLISMVAGTESSTEVYVIELDILQTYWGIRFGLGLDANQNGDLDETTETGFRFMASRISDNRRIYRSDGSVVLGSGTFSAFNRYQFILDRDAYEGAGGLSVYSKDLTTEGAAWEAVPGLQDINMQFDSGSGKNNPENWDAFMFHSESGSPISLYDNITSRKLSISAESLDFDSLHVSLTQTQNVTLTGEGLTGEGLPGALTATLTGDYDFGDGTQSRSSLESGTVLPIRFTPSSAGVKNGTLTISGDDLAKPLQITLTGDGFVNPVLTSAGSLAPILQTETENQGVLLSSLTDDRLLTFGLPTAGVAVVGADNEKGNWEVSTNGGTTWWLLGDVSETSATLLHVDASTRVRFVPGLLFFGITEQTTGTAGLQLRAWNRLTDRSNRTQNFDITDPSVADEFGIETRTASITVTKVNQTPYITEPVGENLLFFDGVSSYLNLTDDMKLYRDQSFTVEAWINISGVKNWQRFFDFGISENNNNILMALSEGMFGTPLLHVLNPNNTNKSVIRSSEAFPLTKWVHTAVVYDSENSYMTLYVQGIPFERGPVTLPAGEPVRVLNYFFRSHWSQDAFTEGYMRDLRIWKQARSGTEIINNMNVQITEPTAGLYANFPLNEGEGTELEDLSGNQRSHVLVNPVWRSGQGFLSGVFGTAGSTIEKTFKVLDIDHAVSDLQVTVTSSTDPTVVALSDVGISGTDTLRTILITPAPSASGSTTLTIRADDLADENNSQEYTIDVSIYQPNSYSLSASSAAINANNRDQATFTAELKDGFDNPLTGLDVFFKVVEGDAGDGSLSAGPWITNTQGQASAVLTSSLANTIKVAAFLGSDDQGDPIDTLAVQVNAIFAGGLGTEASPYQITDWEELANVSYYLSAHYLLTSNLDETSAGYGQLASSSANSGLGWEPLGSAATPFTGVFEGTGKTISDYHVAVTTPGSRPHAGLFGVVEGASLSNLSLSDATVTGESLAGVLAGRVAGTSVLERIAVIRGIVTSSAPDSYAGGFTGELYADGGGTLTVSESSATATVTSPAAGGVFGKASSAAGSSWLLKDSYALTTLKSDQTAAGLIADASGGTLQNSYSAPVITPDQGVSVTSASGIITGEPSGLNVTVSHTFFDVSQTADLLDADSFGRSETDMKSRQTYVGAGWDMDIETANGSLDIWTLRSPGDSGSYVSYPYLTWQTYDNPGSNPASNPIPGLTHIEPVDLAFKATGSDTSLFRPGAGSGTVTDVLVNSGYNGGTSDLLDQDFSYHQMKAVYQLIPSSASPISMNTGSFYIRYDPARLTFVSASKGTFFPEENGALFFETTTRDVTGSEGQPLKQMIFDTGLLSDHPNTALQNNTEPILNLAFTIQKSGLSEVTVDSAKISAFSEDFTGDLSIRYATEADTAKVEFWPGDVTRDGFVDFVDLTGFAASYFASADDPAYRIKYDFGSPSVFNYYHLPISDGDISFRDLIVFATGYSLSLDRRNATQLSGAQTSGSQPSGSQPPGSQLAGTAGQRAYPGDATQSSTQLNPYSESDTGHHHPTASSTSGATAVSNAGAASTAGTTTTGAASTVGTTTAGSTASGTESNDNTATVNLRWTTPEQVEPSVYRFGLMAEGDVQNIRAAQIVLRHDPGMEILGVTLSEQPSSGDETKFSMFRTRENAADSSAWHGVRSEIDIASMSKQPLLEENGTLMTFDVRFDADAEPTSTRIEMDHVTMVNAYGGLLQTSWDESVPPSPEIPASFLLHQNYPNPFNPVTVIAYDLPVQAAVTLEVYSITGQRIAVINRGTQTAGTHFIELDASRWASGAYIYRLRAGDFAQTRKMMLLK